MSSLSLVKKQRQWPIYAKYQKRAVHYDKERLGQKCTDVNKPKMYENKLPKSQKKENAREKHEEVYKERIWESVRRLRARGTSALLWDLRWDAG